MKCSVWVDQQFTRARELVNYELCEKKMEKKPNPGKCIHCLRWHKELTWDHVFPKAWYPTTTSAELYKWQVPSCRECNRIYGKLEEELLIRLALCVDPADPRCAGIVEKGLRAIDPRHGKDEKDARARLAKRHQILRESFRGENIPLQAAYPNFGKHEHIPIEEQMAVTIKEESVRKLSEKIVKGIFYLEDGQFIQSPYHIDFFVLHDESAAPIMDMLEKYGTVHAREPGIVVSRAVAPEDSTSSFFCIEIWGRFKMYAAVTD